MKNAPQRKNIALGSEMEARACAFLEAQGLVAVRRNFRCRVGEIDLVMNDGSTLVFVEVRYRVSKAYGGAGASITFAKQQKVRRAAAVYLSAFHRHPPCRFDVVLIDGGDSPEWIKDAW